MRLISFNYKISSYADKNNQQKKKKYYYSWKSGERVNTHVCDGFKHEFND